MAPVAPRTQPPQPSPPTQPTGLHRVPAGRRQPSVPPTGRGSPDLPGWWPTQRPAPACEAEHSPAPARTPGVTRSSRWQARQCVRRWAAAGSGDRRDPGCTTQRRRKTLAHHRVRPHRRRREPPAQRACREPLPHPRSSRRRAPRLGLTRRQWESRRRQGFRHRPQSRPRRPTARRHSRHHPGRAVSRRPDRLRPECHLHSPSRGRSAPDRRVRRRRGGRGSVRRARPQIRTPTRQPRRSRHGRSGHRRCRPIARTLVDSADSVTRSISTSPSSSRDKAEARRSISPRSPSS